MHLYLLLVSLFCVFCCSTAYPSGAPTKACSSLTPRHSGIAVQRNRAPYTVDAVKQGNKVRITISSPIGEEFEGFILQARSSDDRNKMIDGEFTTTDVTKTIDCDNHRKNTLTQTSASPKKEVTTEWTPRGTLNEEVVFRATVAKTFALFWTEIDSKPIRIRSDGQIATATATMTSNRNSHSIYDDCFTSKGCFGLPSGCAQTTDCEVLLTYAKSPDGVLFSLHGFLDNDMYMAMAISDDGSMGDDNVTECFLDGPNVMSRQSWNTGKNNGRTRELSRTQYEGSYTNGLTSCFWTTPFRSESNGRRYDLNTTNYYILLAKGPMENGRLRYHSDRLPSREAVNFTAFEAIGGEDIADSIKIHGTFMVTAWVGFVSMAILLARHFKNTWENSTLGGVKIWFALHRGFMVAAMAFFITAFIVIFVYKNGWNYQTKNPHAILGCIATSLGILNPIMALFRPAPDHKKRPIFNWLHWGVGNVAHLIAIITIFFAVSLPSSGLKNNFYWVMAIFVIVHLIFHLLYQTHTWTQSKKKNNDLSMNEMNGARSNAHNGQNAQAKNVSDNVFRILLLGIYTIFLFVILIALYALIGVA